MTGQDIRPSRHGSTEKSSPANEKRIIHRCWLYIVSSKYVLNTTAGDTIWP